MFFIINHITVEIKLLYLKTVVPKYSYRILTKSRMNEITIDDIIYFNV